MRPTLFMCSSTDKIVLSDNADETKVQQMVKKKMSCPTNHIPIFILLLNQNEAKHQNQRVDNGMIDTAHIIKD